jgi:two-component system phosphate regulon sensor histidine kinase PhoR
MVVERLAGEAFEALLRRAGGDVLLLVDDRLRILRAGPEAAALARRPVDSLLGMSLIAAFNSVGLDAVARQAMSSEAPASGETQVGEPRRRTFQVDAVPVIPGVTVLVLHDVTVVRIVERVRRDFVANIGHELRTPLSSIKLLAETLSSGSVEDAPTMREFAGQIEREADHLAQLVDEILDLSMIESGETELSLESVDPDEVVADAAARIGPVAARRSIRVRRLAPESPHETRVVADRARLGQALLNLAHNAVKYSHPDGEVRIGWEPRGGVVRFTVSDDGIGIPEAHQARIFERFYKVDRSRARDNADGEGRLGGAGLGLAIVRHLAEAHGGSVGLESEPGRGSTFWVEVPASG